MDFILRLMDFILRMMDFILKNDTKFQVGRCGVAACVITGEADKLTPPRCGQRVAAEISHSAW